MLSIKLEQAIDCRLSPDQKQVVKKCASYQYNHVCVCVCREKEKDVVKNLIFSPVLKLK